MDQSSLVADLIEDGRRFVERFAADGNPVQAAFWVKMDESRFSFLYVVAEIMQRDGPTAAYGAVHAALQKLDECSVSSSEIKVVGPLDPVAREVLARMVHYPGRLVSRLAGVDLRAVAGELTYVYPSHLFTFTHPNPMSTEEISREILRRMTHGTENRQPFCVNLKDGAAFRGVPFAVETGVDGKLFVRFIADVGSAPRAILLEDIESIR